MCSSLRVGSSCSAVRRSLRSEKQHLMISLWYGSAVMERGFLGFQALNRCGMMVRGGGGL